MRALKVPKLTTYIFYDTFPRSGGVTTGIHNQAAQHLTQRLIKSAADKILSTLATCCPSLNVVVIETAGDYKLEAFAVHAFLRSNQIDLHGQTTVVGMTVEPHMVKHYEPCSNILDSDSFILG